MGKRKKKKTEEEQIIEYLIKKGFREITEEEKKTDWYKKEMQPISCETETEEEFERLCNKK